MQAANTAIVFLFSCKYNTEKYEAVVTRYGRNLKILKINKDAHIRNLPAVYRVHHIMIRIYPALFLRLETLPEPGDRLIHTLIRKWEGRLFLLFLRRLFEAPRLGIDKDGKGGAVFPSSPRKKNSAYRDGFRRKAPFSILRRESVFYQS